MRVITTVLATGAVLASFSLGALAQDLSVIESGTYVADPTHSKIHFESNHLGLSTFVARFNDYTTNLVIDADDLENSSLEVTVDPTSIDNNQDLFVEHMSGEDWFNVAEYPEVTFKSTSFEQTSPTQGKVTGDLTIRGVTKPVTLDVKLVGAAMHPMMNVPAFGIEAEGVIKRTEYGMETAIPFVPDDVKLMITAEFHKQE